MSRGLATATTFALPPNAIVLVPVGSIEQHGPHLPLDTDTVIADAVAHRVANILDRDDVVVAPAVPYGASGEHQSFAGTSSIGSEALRDTIVELTRSLRTWATRVIWVNGHGGNVPALRGAVDQLRDEGHDVDWFPCAITAGDLHAGITETSLMLHLRPWAVRLERAEPGNLGSLEDLMPDMSAGGVVAVSMNGVLGDPTGATAEDGFEILKTMAARIADRLVLRTGERG